MISHYYLHTQKIKPTKSDFNEAILKSIGDKDFSGHQTQSFTYKMKQFTSYNELKLAFGANVNVGTLFNFNTNINSDKINKKSALFADFSQIYFSAYMDTPDDGNIYINEETRQKFLPKKPIYINTVNYGRKGIISVESDESYEDLSIAVRAAFNAKIVNGDLSIDAKTKEILQKSEISICIIGGDAEAAVKTVAGFDKFQEYIVNGGVYSKTVYGVPISFSGAYAEDSSSFVSEFEL